MIISEYILVVLFCCCVRIRVPRTKQEIEADYHRKKLAEKFRQRLKSINNKDMDALDLERGNEFLKTHLLLHLYLPITFQHLPLYKTITKMKTGYMNMLFRHQFILVLPIKLSESLKRMQLPSVKN